MAVDIHAVALKEINVEIQRLETALAEAKAAARYHEGRVAAGEPTVAKRTLQPMPVLTSAADSGMLIPSSSPYAKLTQFDAAATVLRNAGMPLKTGDIADAMIAGGFPQTDRKKLAVSLYTSMLRKPELFTKAGMGLWEIAQ